jgi:hypothetical protein
LPWQPWQNLTYDQVIRCYPERKDFTAHFIRRKDSALPENWARIFLMLNFQIAAPVLARSSTTILSGIHLALSTGMGSRNGGDQWKLIQ